MHKNRIIITGGSGFIGTNLVQFYLDRGWIVQNLDIKPPRNVEHSHVWRHVDLLDHVAVSDAIETFNPNYVIHMAARTDLNGKSIDDYPVNTKGVSNLISAMRNLTDLNFVIFASSMLVCQIGHIPKDDCDYCPSTPYGESKVDGEHRVRHEAKDAFPWIIVRPTSIWGPWFGTPYKDFFDTIKNGLYFHPRGHKIKRSYGFVLNVVFQIHSLIQNREKYSHQSIFYLADYEPTDIKEWADIIGIQMKRRRIRECPLIMLKIAATVGDILKFIGINLPIISFRLKNLLSDNFYDMSYLESVVGPLPYDLEGAVTLTCEWMESLEYNR